MTQLSSRFTLLNTRPAHQAEGLTLQVEQAGGRAFNCPTLEIVWEKPEAIQSTFIQEMAAYDKVILTSVNSVQWLVDHYLPKHPSLLSSASANVFSKTQFFAIGKATQQAGLKAKLPVEHLPELPYDSETLLKHADMQKVANESVLIVRGHGGRTLLMEMMAERGAQVNTWEVYSRVPASFCVEAWRAFIQAPTPILLISSAAGFEGLMGNLLNYDPVYALDSLNSSSSSKSLDWSRAKDEPKTHQAWSFLHTVVVFSDRIKELMLQQGWPTDIQVVTRQSDEGIIQTIDAYLSQA